MTADRPRRLSPGGITALSLVAALGLATAVAGNIGVDRALYALSSERFVAIAERLDDASETFRLDDERRLDTEQVWDGVELQRALDAVEPAVSSAAAAGLDATAIGAVSASHDELLALIGEPRATVDDEPLPSAGDVGGAALDERGELDEATERMRERLAAIDDATAALEARQEGIRSALDDLGDAEDALLEAMVPAAEAAIAANPSSTNALQLALRRTADDPSQYENRAGIAAEFSSFASSVDAVRVSHAAREQEKLDPAWPQRAEVEAYARSISGGILLDVYWEPIVLGYGEGNSGAGTATWNTLDQLSEIELSYSIASYWSSESWPRGLVTHEVGHAITAKDGCFETYLSPAFAEDDEIWATAWAMSWGFAASDSGADNYGTPTPEQVALAATCR